MLNSPPASLETATDMHISIIIVVVAIVVAHLLSAPPSDLTRAAVVERRRSATSTTILTSLTLLRSATLLKQVHFTIDESPLILLSTLTCVVLLSRYDARNFNTSPDPSLDKSNVANLELRSTEPQWQLDGPTDPAPAFRSPSPYPPSAKPKPNIFKRLFLCQRQGPKKTDANGLELNHIGRNGVEEEADEYEMANRPLIGISPNPTQSTVPNAPKRWPS